MRGRQAGRDGLKKVLTEAPRRSQATRALEASATRSGWGLRSVGSSERALGRIIRPRPSAPGALAGSPWPAGSMASIWPSDSLLWSQARYAFLRNP